MTTTHRGYFKEPDTKNDLPVTDATQNVSYISLLWLSSRCCALLLKNGGDDCGTKKCFNMR